MPQLPGADQLGVRRFQDQSQVVRPSIDMGGQQRLADTARQVASSVTERLDQSSLQKAKIHFQKKKLEADSAFDQDQDFETYQTRYDEMLGKAAEESAKMVRSPRMQELFKEEISLYQAEGSNQIRKRALGKEIERGVADLDESITMARENYLRATNPADREFARESMLEAIDFAESNSYVDSAKAQDLRKNAALDLAIASVKIEKPENQLKLLKENKGLIDLIPMDTRLAMIKTAEGQFETEAALATANSITSLGGDLSQRMKEADKIKDVKLRENVKQQIGVDYNREKAAKAEGEYTSYDAVKKEVIRTGSSWLEISKANPEQWNSMSADQQQSIISMSAGKSKQSDLNVYNTLNQMAAKDPRQAYVYFTENAHKLSDSDIRKWSDRLAKPEELEGFMSRKELLDAELVKVGVTDKKSKNYTTAIEQMDKDYLQFQKDAGRKPTPDETQKIINGITDKLVDGSWNPFVADKYGFDLTPQERKASRNATAQNEKMAVFEERLNEYRSYLESKSGDVPVSLTDEQIDNLYMAWDRDGLLDGN